jgi:hypothetical protein
MRHSPLSVALCALCALALGLAGSSCGPDGLLPAASDAAEPPADASSPAPDAEPAPDDLVIHTGPTPAPPAAGEELPIEVVRTFTCRHDQVLSERVLAAVAGEAGAVVLIRPGDARLSEPPSSGQAPTPQPDCQYQLVFRAADGDEQLLGPTPDGYLFAAALRTSAGLGLLCVNAIRHTSLGGLDRHIEAVELRCSASPGFSEPFGPLTPVVSPDGDWAPWLRTLSAIDSPSGAGKSFSLRYVRDFSFQFFNLSDRGRPATDGLYELLLEVSSAGALISPLGAPSRLDARTNPLSDIPIEPWRPSDAERVRLDPVFRFSNRTCLDGCPGP